VIEPYDSAAQKKSTPPGIPDGVDILLGEVSTVSGAAPEVSANTISQTHL